MTPDLLNFKKGWMVRLDENEQWRKYWFVLSTDSLRYYKDSMAEEASDLEGEIELTKCYNVSEYQVQRNYGFQIHTPKGVSTLSAMTSGIRKNWIQALMKNVHPANAPDVASLPGHHAPSEPLPKPDVTRDSSSSSSGASADLRPKRRTVMEKRREGHYRTFDWAEFRPRSGPTADADPPRTEAPGSLELGDRERRRRREERRRRYESMLGISLGGGVRALSPRSQQKVEEEIEGWWRVVERTGFRAERSVSLCTESGESRAEKLRDSDGKAMEDLKAQLAESESHRPDLEAQLRTAGFHQLDPSPSPATDTGLTQTLKDTYTETRELLRQQNAIRQDLRDQLGSEAPAAARRTPGVWLRDADGNLRALLEELLPETVATPSLPPAAGGRGSFSRSDGETARRNEPDGKSRPRALGSATRVDRGPLIPERPAEGEEDDDDEPPSCRGEYQVSPGQARARKLSQEVELLTSRNEALDQRNQEMLNQLSEADREIGRLKAELRGRRGEEEQLRRTDGGEGLERELSLRSQQLLEAQTVITSLEESLREAEAPPQPSVPAEAGETGREDGEEGEGCLLNRCLEAELTELKTQLDQSEETCRELQKQNAALTEAEEVRRLTAAEAEGEERIQEVMEGMVTKFKALGALLEAIERLAVGTRKEESEENRSTGWLRREEEFWRALLNKLRPSDVNGDGPVEELLREVTECMTAEQETPPSGRRLLAEEDEGSTKQPRGMERLRVAARAKTSSLEHLASSVGASAPDEPQPMADCLSDFSEHRWSAFVLSAATEAFHCHRLSRRQEAHERELEEGGRRPRLTSCGDAAAERQSSAAGEMNAGCQTEEAEPQDADAGLQVRGPSSAVERRTPGTAEEEEEEEEETAEAPELDCADRRPCDEGQTRETDVSFEAERVSPPTRRRRVEEPEEELEEEPEEQPSVGGEEMREEFERKMNSFQTQHEKEMEKMKVTCERGFTSMEASHARVVEELRHRHRREVERLLVERDRLLEEESGATATAIDAIRKAHLLELEKEVQRRCRSERSTGDAHLEDIYRQHREELTSQQRELHVLSQQFSLKCLENGHLVQALDAERKALCQCQQENQDLRTRNQELSGHLAAEITRLCSLAKQDELPLTQGMDVYEMEITLRVKESEVQCLKQEITSLREEVQSAQRDKRNAVKKYKDVFTELSVTRAKIERETDELRENLRLARHALEHTSP